MSAQHALITILEEKLKSDRLILPTLPEVALRVRKLSDDENINLQQMADVVAQDAALAARMIKVANSAFLGRQIACVNLQQAVTRIGLSQIKQLATAFALEQLFVSQYAVVQQWLDKLWRDNIQTAAVAVASLQLYQQQHHATTVNAQELLLCGLVHNIGALAVMSEAERHPDVFGHPVFLQTIMDKISPYVSVKILKSWGFSAEIQEAAKNWRICEGGTPPDYTDFIRLAAIARGYYQSPEAEIKLLQHYLSQKVVSVPKFTQEPEFTQLRDNVYQLFS